MTQQTRVPARNRLPVACALLVALALLPTAFAQLPEFLQAGWRLTWEGGDSEVINGRLVRDIEGDYEIDGNLYSVQSGRGPGGVGVIQLDILSAGQEAVVADVRFYRNVDLQTNTLVLGGADLVIGNVSELGEYWVSPARLAALQPSRQGGRTITRGTRQFGNQVLNVVSIADVIGNSYHSLTYDLASGLLLFSGTIQSANTGASFRLEGGGSLDLGGTAYQSHKRFAGVRALNVPWANQPPPSWAAPGRASFYRGENRVEYFQASSLGPLPGQPVAVTYAFDQVVGNAVLGREINESSVGQGLPTQGSTTNRAFGSGVLGGLWLPPQVIGQLQPQQVIDQDPFTRQTTFFGGVTNGLALMVMQGPADSLEQYYDVNSGLLLYSRYRQQQASVGFAVIEVQLVGQQ